MSGPCGDPGCICCHPDLYCGCPYRPADPPPGTVYRCPNCDAAWTALPWRSSPAAARTAPLLIFLGITEPTIAWKQLSAPTRIPGSLP